MNELSTVFRLCRHWLTVCAEDAMHFQYWLTLEVSWSVWVYLSCIFLFLSITCMSSVVVVVVTILVVKIIYCRHLHCLLQQALWGLTFLTLWAAPHIILFRFLDFYIFWIYNGSLMERIYFILKQWQTQMHIKLMQLTSLQKFKNAMLCVE